MVKHPPASSGDAGLIPGSGRSPGEGNGNPLQYSCLGSAVGRGGGTMIQRQMKDLEVSVIEYLDESKV